MINLCHKCSGVLVHEKDDNIAGLLDCWCISSYYRGFEKDLTRAEAIQRQIQAQIDWFDLFKRQERSARELAPIEANFYKLLELQEKE